MACTVLVVDDAADIRLLVRSVLTGAGFAVVEAASGVEALAHIEQALDLPDVIVLDVQMPDVDGWTTLAALRGHHRAADVAVIMSTVRASAADEARGRALGCDDYLTKPFDIRDLVARVVALAPTTAEPAER